MVDTGADVCGTADTLAVEAGTTVRYCYTVTNTGDTPLTEHTLMDDRLGTLLSDFAFVLDPGASTSVTGTAVITDAITNTATWFADNNSLEIYDIEATDDLTVTIAVPPTTTTTTTRSRRPTDHRSRRRPPPRRRPTPPAVLPPTGPASPVDVAGVVRIAGDRGRLAVGRALAGTDRRNESGSAPAIGVVGTLGDLSVNN